METWQGPGGPLQLGRHPYDIEDRGLQAWNGADLLLAQQLELSDRPLRVLILNDHYGCLTAAALRLGYSVRFQNDSYVAKLACLQNLLHNGLDPEQVLFLDSLAGADNDDWQPHMVLLQLPKANQLLEYQLAVLSSSLPSGTPIWGGAMTRDVHNSNIQLFEKLIGPSTTSLAAHKARLIHSILEPTTVQGAAKVIKQWPRLVPLQATGLPELELLNHAGVFSAGAHDAGSLLLLQYLADAGPALIDTNPSAPLIADCGCGNGLLALVAASLFPQAQMICADESYMAIASCQAAFARKAWAERARFLWTDCLQGLESDSTDLVLCNPPFHQGQSQTLAIALRMFQQARNCLKPGGRLLVVANRHLGHHRNLEDMFGQVQIVAEDGRYMVIAAGNPLD